MIIFHQILKLLTKIAGKVQVRLDLNNQKVEIFDIQNGLIINERKISS